jgi:hypothetical protein
MNIRDYLESVSTTSQWKKLKQRSRIPEKQKNIVLGRVTSALPTTRLFEYTLRFLQKREMDVGSRNYICARIGPAV